MAADHQRHTAEFSHNDRMVSLCEYEIRGLCITAEWNFKSVVQPKACSTRLSALEYLKLLIDNEIAKEILES